MEQQRRARARSPASVDPLERREFVVRVQLGSAVAVVQVAVAGRVVVWIPIRRPASEKMCDFQNHHIIFIAPPRFVSRSALPLIVGERYFDGGVGRLAEQHEQEQTAGQQ